MSEKDEYVFFGNEASVHLEQWLRIYHGASVIPTALFTVHELGSLSLRKVKVFFLSKYISYILLGLRARILKNIIVHAHGASGYGLAALFSGKKYVVTVYGSEILGDHGFLYNFMISRVLGRASAITVTSAQAEVKVKSLLKNCPGKVYSFHTGIDAGEIDRYDFPSEIDGFSLNTNYIFSLRNTGKQYRSEEIIKAFISSGVGELMYCKLVLILGNGDLKYFSELRNAYKNEDLVFIQRKLTHLEACALIASSKLCLNYPVTDQLSTSILEALYFGRRVLTADLPAYAVLDEVVPNGMIIKSQSSKLFSRHIFQSYGEVDEELVSETKKCVRDLYSVESASLQLNGLLNERVSVSR